MIFKETFKADVREVNFNQRVNNKFILKCLENISSSHSESVGAGIHDLLSEGKTWIVLDWQIKLENRPTYNDTIEIHTWSRGTNKIYSYRDFEIYSGGSLCGIATSKWLIFDINSKKIAKPDNEFVSKYKPETDKLVFGVPEPYRMKRLDEYDGEYQFPLRKTDIDINGHMHNLNYIDIAYEAFDKDVFKNEPNNIRISYKKDIKYGDKISCQYKAEDGKYHFSVVDTDTKNIHANIEMF